MIIVKQVFGQKKGYKPWIPHPNLWVTYPIFMSSLLPQAKKRTSASSSLKKSITGQEQMGLVREMAHNQVRFSWQTIVSSCLLLQNSTTSDTIRLERFSWQTIVSSCLLLQNSTTSDTLRLERFSWQTIVSSCLLLQNSTNKWHT